MEPLWDYILEGMPVEEEAKSRTRTRNPARGPCRAPSRSPSWGAPTWASPPSSTASSAKSAPSSRTSPGPRGTPSTYPSEPAGKDFLLVDTAGIRRHVKTGPGAEILSVVLARGASSNATSPCSCSTPPSRPATRTPTSPGLIEAARRGVVLVLNKWDLVKGEAAAREVEEAVLEKFVFMDYLPIVRVSAHSGRGTDKVLPAAARAYRQLRSGPPHGGAQQDAQDRRPARLAAHAPGQGTQAPLRHADGAGAAHPDGLHELQGPASSELLSLPQEGTPADLRPGGLAAHPEIQERVSPRQSQSRRSGRDFHAHRINLQPGTTRTTRLLSRTARQERPALRPPGRGGARAAPISARGSEDAPALRDGRVGQGEEGRLHHEAPHEEHVDVQGARAVPRPVRLRPSMVFHALAVAQEQRRRELRLHPQDLVEKPPLGGHSTGSVS